MIRKCHADATAKNRCVYVCIFRNLVIVKNHEKYFAVRFVSSKCDVSFRLCVVPRFVYFLHLSAFGIVQIRMHPIAATSFENSWKGNAFTLRSRVKIMIQPLVRRDALEDKWRRGRGRCLGRSWGRRPFMLAAPVISGVNGSRAAAEAS